MRFTLMCGMPVAAAISRSDAPELAASHTAWVAGCLGPLEGPVGAPGQSQRRRLRIISHCPSTVQVW